MEIQELLSTIKDAAFDVRLALAYGYLESVYKHALAYELHLRGLKADIEYPIKVYYKNIVVGEFRADIFVEESVIVELKTCAKLVPAHEAQLVNYLRATGIDYGYLINYGSEKFQIRVKTREYTP